MTSDIRDDKVQYQRALRAAGAYLDAHGADDVTLIEGPGAFLIRYGMGGSDAGTHGVVLSLEELAPDGPGHPRRSLHWPHPGGGAHRGYEDLLRAIGWELEQLDARNLLLDEQDDGIMVTYQHYNPIEGYMLRKRLVCMGETECRDVVAAAHRRRRPHGVERLVHRARATS